jgi:RNA recognition motif-containing protein
MESSSIYIYNLDQDARELFELYGQIEKVNISNGVVSVTYTNSQDATNALDAMNGDIVNDKIIYVTKDNPHLMNQKGGTIYIYNIKPKTSLITIGRFFYQFGAIKTVNYNKGVAIVSFVEHGSALAALHCINGKTLSNNVIKITLDRPANLDI